MDTYEKKYKEEVDRATRLWECGDITRENLEYIFPELAESEDERIRKELLEHCKNQAETYIQTGNKCPQIQSWITWLENQDKKKSAKWDKEDDRIYYSLLADIRTRLDGSTNTLEAYYNEQINWLKSIKQRIKK